MNFLKRPWKKLYFRILVGIIGSLATLYVLFFAWMNYSGAKDWRAAQARLQNEGESLDFRAIALDPVPEEKNFCAISLLKDIPLIVDHDPEKGEPGARRKRVEEAALPAVNGPRPSSRPSLGPGASLGTPADLKAWADWLRKEGLQAPPADSANAARSVLAALSKNDALFAELASGLSRPESHWTPDWKTRELPEMLYAIALPHYQCAQHLVTTLALRATAAARAGDAATAHQSLLIALRVARASLNDPFLIGELVACSQATQIEDAIWEACDAHAGTADDFRRLQEELTKLNFEKALVQSFRSELAAGVGAVDWLKKNCNLEGLAYVQGARSDPHPGFLAALLLKCIPGGFFDMNSATIANLEFDHLIKPLRDGGLRGGLAEGDVLDEMLMHQMPPYHLDKVFARLMIPAFGRVTVRTAYTQCLTNQAIAACVLERWFIEHHQYPDSLEALALPADPLSGKPMGYRKTSDGKYALWCVGVDGKDDGGKRQLDARKPESTKFGDRKYKGDWVWSYQP